MPHPHQDALDHPDLADCVRLLDRIDPFGPFSRQDRAALGGQPLGSLPPARAVETDATRGPGAPIEPFEPLRSAQPCASGAFFDRAGLGWIAVCVALAGAAGQVIPRLGEPGGWQAAGQVFEFSAADGLFGLSDADRGKAPAPSAQALPVGPVQVRTADAQGPQDPRHRLKATHVRKAADRETM